jgi:ribosome-binding factor A
MRIIQRRVIASQLSPPVVQTSPGLTERKIRIEDHAIRTVVVTFQQVIVIQGKSIGRVYLSATPLETKAVTLYLFVSRRTSFSQRSLGKGLGFYQSSLNIF